MTSTAPAHESLALRRARAALPLIAAHLEVAGSPLTSDAARDALVQYLAIQFQDGVIEGLFRAAGETGRRSGHGGRPGSGLRAPESDESRFGVERRVGAGGGL